MNRCRTIALEKWPRRAMYEFYRTFVSDAFDVTATVNAEKLYARAHACGDSFFLLSAGDERFPGAAAAGGRGRGPGV